MWGFTPPAIDACSADQRERGLGEGGGKVEGVAAVEAQVGASIGEDRAPCVAVRTGAVQWWRGQWRLPNTSIPVGQSRPAPEGHHCQCQHPCEWVEDLMRLHEAGMEDVGR